MTTTPDALKLAANLRDWAEDAEEHNSHFVPLTAKTLLLCSSIIEQQHAALESLRSEVESLQDQIKYHMREQEAAAREMESLRAGRAVPDVVALMEAADEYADLSAKAHAENLYGTSKSYTRQCICEARKSRSALQAMLTAAAPTPLQAEQAQPDDARDAKRYRWLRHGDNDEKVLCNGPIDKNYWYLLRAEKLDAAIDAALASSARKGE